MLAYWVFLSLLILLTYFLFFIFPETNKVVTRWESASWKYPPDFASGPGGTLRSVMLSQRIQIVKLKVKCGNLMCLLAALYIS